MSDPFAKSLGRISGPLLKDNLVRNGVDLAFETDLLYFDTVNQRLGIKTDSPSHLLSINGTASTHNLIVDTLIKIDQINIDNNQTISPLVGNLFLTSTTIGIGDSLQFDSFFVKNNEIKVSDIDSDFLLNSTGRVNFTKSIDIDSNLIVKKSADLLGNAVFGINENNIVEFKSTIESDVNPSETLTFNLGTPNLRWQTFNSEEINGQDFATVVVDVGGVDIGLLQGNILYVAKNGTDRDSQDGFPNSGVHQQAPWLTIKYALARAVAGDTVYVFPGIYEEEFPLTVPAGVTVRGFDLRNTIVKPLADYNNQDAFLLDGETTISDITIKDFYYNSDDNTGYAFKFLQGGKVSSRSPYVQNISVITRGSVITSEDPLGFDSIDAGRGAYIDGSDFTSDTKEASLLFHSATFITPGVDAIVMTNGVRVEWLNSFIYFADRGLVALQGTGRITGNSTLKFGAELRSIGSANVYGNIGAVADGEDTLMYLINHNFGYIGSGKDSSNDKTLAIIENETQEFNNGRIYFQSQAHDGNFRVGDIFFADQATGRTSIDLSDIAIGGVARLTVSTNGSVTILDADFIETGNISFVANTASSLTGDLNIVSATGEINYLGDLYIQKNLKIHENLKIDGSLIGFGDQTSDLVFFESKIREDLKPSITETYNLGSNSLNWKTVWTSNIILDQTKFSGNTVETKTDNANLKLTATGNIKFFETDVVFQETLTVNGIFDFKDLDLNGDINETGNRNQDGNYNQTGDFNLTGNITTSGDAAFEEISFVKNEIIASNDLILKSDDKILFDNNNVVLKKNLYINLIDIGTAIQAAEVAATEFYTDNILISGNTVETPTENTDLILKATGNINITGTDVTVDNDLEVNGSTSLNDTNIVGDISHTGNRTQNGVYSQTGDLAVSQTLSVTSDATFEEIKVSKNEITTTPTNRDLKLEANGTGVVQADTNTRIQQNLTVLGFTSVEDLTVENFVNAQNFKTSDIDIYSNRIETYTTDTDLEIESTSGSVVVEGITVTDNKLSTSTTDLNFAALGSIRLNAENIVVPKGTTTEKTAFDIGNFRLDTTESVFEGYYTSKVGFGGVFSDNKQTSVTAHPFDNTLRFKVKGVEVGRIVDSLSQSVILHELSSQDNLIIRQNLITNKDNEDSSLDDIILNPDLGKDTVVENSVKITGSNFVNLLDTPISFRNTGRGYVAFIATTAIVVPYGSISDRSFVEVGDTRWNTDLDVLEVFNGEEYQPATGVGDIVSTSFMEDLTNEWSLILG